MLRVYLYSSASSGESVLDGSCPASVGASYATVRVGELVGLTIGEAADAGTPVVLGGYDFCYEVRRYADEHIPGRYGLEQRFGLVVANHSGLSGAPSNAASRASSASM